MSFVLSALPAPHRAYARLVCQSLRDGSVARAADGALEPVNVYGDGSLSPAGERYAATRLACSWRVVFDFRDGRTHHVTVELPDACYRGA